MLSERGGSTRTRMQKSLPDVEIQETACEFPVFHSLSLSLSDIIKKLTLRNGRFHRLVYLSCAGQGPASLHRRSTFISRPFCLDAGQCRGVRERTAAGVQET